MCKRGGSRNRLRAAGRPARRPEPEKGSYPGRTPGGARIFYRKRHFCSFLIGPFLYNSLDCHLCRIRDGG